MAGYECSLCGGDEPATILITPLQGGETMAVGNDCMAVAFTGMLAGHLEVDPEELWKAAERVIKARDRKAAKGHTEAPAPPAAEPTESDARQPEGELAEVGGDG